MIALLERGLQHANLILGWFDIGRSWRYLFVFDVCVVLRQRFAHNVLVVVKRIIDVKGARRQQQEQTKVRLNLAIKRYVHVPSNARKNADRVGSKAVHVQSNGQRRVVFVIVILRRRNDGHVAATVDSADLHKLGAVFVLVVAE